ncbi:MAG TPA: redoxin domain-containing protein [Thermoanaerobaculia bacterium]|nr:redoxin domain-containing protein [Thermoanaerobaculia bacterium]
MPRPSSSVSIGDEAPNFDLSSTENAVLMLKDELARTSVLLYFFASAESDRVRRDLEALERRREALKGLRGRILGVSPLTVDALRKVQADSRLRFPLLCDDRNFSASYGVGPIEEGRPADPALVLVSRKQKILFVANPVAAVEEALPQVEKLLKDLPSPTRDYPKSVINRWIDRWVN